MDSDAEPAMSSLPRPAVLQGLDAATGRFARLTLASPAQITYLSSHRRLSAWLVKVRRTAALALIADAVAGPRKASRPFQNPSDGPTARSECRRCARETPTRQAIKPIVRMLPPARAIGQRAAELYQPRPPLSRR